MYNVILGVDVKMIELFIPVLIVCLNMNCEFMQAQTHYASESACRSVVEEQRAHMLTLVNEAKKSSQTASVIEGTCITAQLKSRLFDA